MSQASDRAAMLAYNVMKKISDKYNVPLGEMVQIYKETAEEIAIDIKWHLQNQYHKS